MILFVSYMKLKCVFYKKPSRVILLLEAIQRNLGTPVCTKPESGIRDLGTRTNRVRITGFCFLEYGCMSPHPGIVNSGMWGLNLSDSGKRIALRGCLFRTPAIRFALCSDLFRTPVFVIADTGCRICGTRRIVCEFGVYLSATIST